MLTKTTELEYSQMGKVPCLQGAHQNFKFMQFSQILQAGVFHEKRPAGESRADTAFQPVQRLRRSPQNRVDRGDLIIRVVGVSKRFWARACQAYTFHRLLLLSGQSVEEAPQTDRERLTG